MRGGKCERGLGVGTVLSDAATEGEKWELSKAALELRCVLVSSQTLRALTQSRLDYVWCLPFKIAGLHVMPLRVTTGS